MKYKVLLIQEVLSSYNDPVYEIINKDVDLTVAYTTKTEVPNTVYKSFQLEYSNLGPFIIHKNVNKILSEYDVVIFVPHLRFLKLITLPFLPHKYKVITWSIGVHASYSEPFNLSKSPSLKDRIFEQIQDHSDAAIFYMKEPIEYWQKYKKIDTKHYFVAHNTVKIFDFGELPIYDSRTSLLFVGTLYAQKGLGELIDAYKIAKSKTDKLPLLNIVGKGPEKETIEQQIHAAGLDDVIIMRGPIYDESILKDYFLNAKLCISPKQAGLSVQKSLGYGVPFVTRPDAITGGERLDVKDGYTGLFYNTVEELSDIIIRSAIDKDTFKKMSENARDYYLNYASPELMAKGAIDAINYVMSKR